MNWSRKICREIAGNWRNNWIVTAGNFNLLNIDWDHDRAKELDG